MNHTIILQTPNVRGESRIDQVDIRKPVAGELRGVSLVDLLQMDVGALTTVLPRVTVPSLTAAEVGNMDPADLLDMGGKVAGFLLKNPAAPADCQSA